MKSEKEEKRKKHILIAITAENARTPVGGEADDVYELSLPPPLSP